MRFIIQTISGSKVKCHWTYNWAKFNFIKIFNKIKYSLILSKCIMMGLSSNINSIIQISLKFTQIDIEIRMDPNYVFLLQ